MLPRMVLSRSSSSLVAALSRPALASRSVVGPASVAALSQLSLASRAYSAAAKLKESEDDFFGGFSEPRQSYRSSSRPPSRSVRPSRSGRPMRDRDSVIPEDGLFRTELEDDGVFAAEQAPPRDHSGTETERVPFSSLKGRVLPNTLKAVTFKPLNLASMSEVQRRVLSGMPELSGGRTPAEMIANETPEETAAREARVAAGRQDLLVKAKTGTGKTLAFLMPALDARIHSIDKLAAQPKEDGEVPTSAVQGLIRREKTRSNLGALIISPTRELATQIANEALKLVTWHKDMQVHLLVGGGNRMQQLKKWKSMRLGRKDIVVATPGRLVDLLNEPAVAEAVATTDTFILDEADTLLEMGFAPDLNAIVDHLPKERQTFLFSATVSPAIRKVARDFLKPNHSLIDCVPENESNVHLHIPQYVTVLPSSAEQLKHIARLIAHDQLTNENSKVIVFLPTTKQTMLFATLMREMADTMPNGLSVHEIHSRLTQDRRSRANERFRKDRRASVLVTSDVSARGVDYPGVTRVIQVGIPSTTDQYVHRVGRTGRGSERTGRGDIVLLPFEAGFAKALHSIKVPLNETKVEDIATDVAELSQNDSRTAQRVSAIDSTAAEVVTMLDPEAISEVFGSLMGYYVSKTAELGTSKHNIYRGLQDWTVGAAGLENPIRLSPMMMKKFGMDQPEGSNRPQKRNFGFRPRDGGNREGGFGARSPRDGGFRSSRNFDDDRRGGFRPRDREGGFRPRQDRDGGFRSRGDRDGGFRRADYE